MRVSGSMAPRARSLGFAALLLLGLAGTARAEVAPPDPLDIAMRACEARDDRSSPIGQIACMNDARKGWQHALQDAYEQLLGTLPPTLRRGWQISQNRWLIWRADEAALEQAVYATTQGSTYTMAQADMQLQPVRFRAQTLREIAGYDPHAYGTKIALHAVRSCSEDAQCEHAMFDMNRYQARLAARLPQSARPLLIKAQREWNAFCEATAPLISEEQRVDLIGSRVAALKRLSETVDAH